MFPTDKPSKRIERAGWIAVIATSSLVVSACGGEARPPSDDELRTLAGRLAGELIIVDTHIDVPYRLTERMEDVSVRTEHGNFDFPRAKEGGLDAGFMSIYIPSSYEGKAGVRLFADSLIDMVQGLCLRHPDKFAAAGTTDDIRRNHERGLVSLPMGMENGSPLGGDLRNLRYFFDRGIRYITLTHAKNNHICDSSYDTERKWNGLSPFGYQVVSEMNRLGMMIDVSHISDSSFYQVIRTSKAPVIASHSSCRFFTPDWERNMSDEMIKRLAENGGVVQINFGSSFLTEDLHTKWSSAYGEINKYLEEHALRWDDEEAQPFIRKYREEREIGFADLSDVVAHIQHVVDVAGVDYVGFGSDFDGVGDSLPEGLKDVSMYPNLIFELLKKGYSVDDIRKICGENLLRVWAKVEETAVMLQQRGT